MKYLAYSVVLVLLALFLFTGCADKQIILVPQTEYYPTFNTDDFNTSKKVELDMWVEEEDVNGTTKTYLVADKDEMLYLIKDTKTLRSTYNVLLKQLNIFNERIKELNRLQNEKQPKEVDTIKDSWFK